MYRVPLRGMFKKFHNCQQEKGILGLNKNTPILHMALDRMMFESWLTQSNLGKIIRRRHFDIHSSKEQDFEFYVNCLLR